MRKNVVVIKCEKNIDVLYRILSIIRKRYPELERMSVRGSNEKWLVETTLRCSEMDCELIWRKLNSTVGVEVARVYSLQEEKLEIPVKSPSTLEVSP